MVKTEIPSKPSATLYEIVRRWAEETPEAIALIAAGREAITYRQLLGHIDATVSSLRAMGLGRNARIATVLPNNIDAAVLLLGISCAAVAVPVNPALRETELEFLLPDVDVAALLVQSAGALPAALVARRHGVPVIESAGGSAGDLPRLVSPERTAPFNGNPGPPDPDNIALILQTSGTTSTPKRVPLSHGNLCASAHSIRESLALTPADRCLGIMPLFHIHGLVGTLLSSLAGGGSFFPAPEWEPEYFFDWMTRFRTTWYSAVPTLHYAVLSRARERMQAAEESPLRFIRSASAPLPMSLRVELERAFQVPVIEAYGMTEAAHQIASNPLPPKIRKPGSVGVPTGTEVAIMDEGGHLLSAGESGEVVIRGPNVMSGYEPHEVNEQRFVNGWLRTGDLGYLDEDGYLFLTARLKDIVNRGGEKILPRQIEDALLEHPDVLEAAAFAVPHASLGEDVAAAVVLRHGSNATEASLREYLIGRLAAFKLPAQLLIVDRIPAGPTGKVQRAALAEIFAAGIQTPLVAPQDTLEQVIAEIYAEVLNAPRVSVCENFFALGGDSLRATQVISRIRSLLSVNLPIAAVFSNSTVRQLAGVIAAMKSSDGHSEQIQFVSRPDAPQGDLQPPALCRDGSGQRN
jgi:acyl-CoA synthetase (AMP-forming)/AMP-acid ligase II